MYDYDALLQRPIREKLPEFERENRLKHVIFASQLNRSLLDKLRSFADTIRKMSKMKETSDALRDLLSHKRAMLYFTQPSTRTFLSFTAACQVLGIHCNEVRDARLSSMVEKKESEIDSVRMFSSYFDVIIMRSKTADIAERCAYLMNDLEGFNRRTVPIVNGGSGADQHPTQALLDVYTLQRTFDFDHPRLGPNRFNELRQIYPDLTRGLDGKTYAFCGDIGRGRTVRSLARLLAQYRDVTMYFVAPDHPKLHLGDGLREQLIGLGVDLHEVDSLDATVEGQPLLSKIDCLYMTRIQQEHDTLEDKEAFREIDLTHYRLNIDRVERMKQFAPIMHPFPRDSEAGEIPTDIDGNPRAMYFRQARNGMWARAALLVHLFDVDDDLVALNRRFFAESSDYGVNV
ncbi:MAG: hypothetical protein MI757_14885 [Pirellulales bacterium]|nr:hypothetical protein [Pirellulales bacterium]